MKLGLVENIDEAFEAVKNGREFPSTPIEFSMLSEQSNYDMAFGDGEGGYGFYHRVSIKWLGSIIKTFNNYTLYLRGARA